MSIETEAREAHDPCPQCYVGGLKRAVVTFSAVRGGSLILVPDLDALLCDVCGYREFPAHSAEALATLLGRPVNADEVERSAVKRSPADEYMMNQLRKQRQNHK